MGDAVEIILLIIGFLIGALLAVAAVVGTAIGVTLVYAMWFPIDYLSVMVGGLKSEPPGLEEIERSHVARAFRLGSRSDRLVAIPNYFFGAAENDIRATIVAATRRCANDFNRGARVITESGGELWDIIVDIGLAVGLFLGGILGTLMAVSVATVHVIMASCSIVVAVLIGMTLRLADSTMRFARGIAIRCPNSECSRAIRPYPAYRCSGCNELHRDIRPGPYGVIFRACTCGERLPTLLITGSARLAALCQVCDTELPKKIGKAAEIVIPLFGSVAAGKTQLIYTLTLALRTLVRDGGGVLNLDENTQEKLDRIGELLAATGNTNPTLSAVPEPYIMTLKLGLNERLFYLFDAAGELHYKLPALESLGYLDKGRTLVFVVDPLASDGIWNRLPEQERQKLAVGRSNAIDIQIAYEQTREQMRRMGRRVKRIQLAFVVSKIDLLDSSERPKNTSGEEIRRMLMSAEALDMGNHVREAEQRFKSVHFFTTAAITDEEGIADESVVKLATWILRSEGITIKEP